MPPIRLRVAAVALPAALALGASTTAGPRAADKPEWTEQARKDALRRAVVWQPPQTPIESADLARTPGTWPDQVRCKFKVDEVNGLTPKFECELADGEVVKVKYSGPEPYGEVAASRLLRALGFAADHVSFVKRVRCYGCPHSHSPR